ncbi:MAG: hypothetical protein HKO72_06370, partial [Flavobacteriaceae bacterium]|nr:hypothetical protein [Bacteroidia bacterium]NNL60946.1 hypothetical protein [Flavobacteriaceae bacterium]
KNTDKTIPEIAKELGVSYVVEGSVRQTDDEMLITAQLIDATDKHLWSDNYRKTKDNVFDVQRDVSQQIVEQLKLTITPEQQKIINRPLTKNQDAMKLYLKARDMSDVSEGVSAIPIRQSIGLLKQAIELDPEFASAYAEIANSNFLLVTGGHLPLVEGEKETREWIKQALEIDPNNARAYSAIGFINAFKFCVIEATDIFWDNATENLEKSIQINPNDHRVLHHYAKLHNWGKNGKNRDEDIYLKQLELAIQIEPLSYLIITEYINALIVTNKYDKARELLLEKKFILGEYPGRNIHYSIVESWHQKDWKAGLEVWKKAVEDHPENANFWVNLGYKKISVQNDLSKAIKDFKKAYELDPKTGVDYANTLIENGDFKIVESLMKDQDFINAHDDNVVSKLMYYNIYMLEDYEKCIDEFDNLEPGEFENTIKAISYYKLGNKDKANEIKTKHINFDFNKITYFSEINQRDSLYHYLDKLEFFIAEIRIRHLYFTLRKHKNDPRFVAFLEKNYLPVISNK